MHFHPTILAAGDDALIKVIFWVVIGIIWLISSIVSAIKKKAEQSQKRLESGEVPIELTPTMEMRREETEFSPLSMRAPPLSMPPMAMRTAPLVPFPFDRPPLK